MEDQNIQDLMKQNLITRESQFQADIQLLRSELQMTRSQLQIATNQLQQSQDSYSQLKLELSTALAASQIRVEQLSNLLQDQKAELFDYKHSFQQTRSQLDAAREAYLQLQRQAQDSENSRQQLQMQYTDLKLHQQKDLEQFKQAVVGASHILNQNADFSMVIQTIQDASGTKNKTEFILAKLAFIAAENRQLQQVQAELRKQNESLEAKLRKTDGMTKLMSQGVGGVQLLYDELNSRDEFILKLEEEKKKTELGMEGFKKKVFGLEKQIEVQKGQIQQYKKNLEEVGELRVIIRDMIKAGGK